MYYGWYEMYPAFPVNYTNTVKPGDHFSASVTFTGTETYTLVLTDSTQGWTQTITQNESGLARSSAEVITEFMVPRCRAIFSVPATRENSVAVGPGQTLVTVTPEWRSS